MFKQIGAQERTSFVNVKTPDEVYVLNTRSITTLKVYCRKKT